MDSAPTGLAAAADELYGGSPDDFVERRKALVAAARTAKDRALATAIGRLRRPTRSAWLVNLYARRFPDEVSALLGLGAALQAAQQQLSAPDLRRLSAERSAALTAATRRAAALGEDLGYGVSEAVRQEVTQTLQAALTDPEIAAQVRSGIVTEAHSYGGFGVFGSTAPDVAPTSSGAPSSSAPGSQSETAADQLRAEAERALEEAEAALSSAAEEAEADTGRADALAERVEALRAGLAVAERAEAEARTRARAARRTVSELEAAVRRARAAYEAL